MMNKRMRIVTTPGNLARDIAVAWNAPEICPECEHQLIDQGVLKCPTCTAADRYEGPIQTEDF